MWCCSFFLSMYCLFLPCAANGDKQRQAEPRGTESLPPSGATTHCINTHTHKHTYSLPSWCSLGSAVQLTPARVRHTHSICCMTDLPSPHTGVLLLFPCSVHFSKLCIIHSLIHPTKKYCGGDMHNILIPYQLLAKKYIRVFIFFIYQYQ